MGRTPEMLGHLRCGLVAGMRPPLGDPPAPAGGGICGRNADLLDEPAGEWWRLWPECGPFSTEPWATALRVRDAEDPVAALAALHPEEREAVRLVLEGA